jgi:hypothetical protein
MRARSTALEKQSSSAVAAAALEAGAATATGSALAPTDFMSSRRSHDSSGMALTSG